METLLQKLLSIILENAGATKGVLILRKNDSWFIEGICESMGTKIEVLQHIHLNDYQNIPNNIIQ